MISSPLSTLRQVLQERELSGVAPDSEAFTDIHRRILARKTIVRRVFAGFYRRCRDADLEYFGACRASLRVELGSGAGFLKEVYPDVVTSDVKHLSFVDLVARGEELPFAAGTVRALYAMNVFHHLSNPRAFFSEILRVVAPGGGVVMIEPHYGPLARFVFKRLFTMESYETDVSEWSTHGRRHVASDANQALSYVVLRRDLRQWEREFPNLELVLDQPHTHLGYLLSGGVNFHQLVPDGLADLVFWFERRLRSLDGLLGLQHTLVVRHRLGSSTRGC